MQVHDTVHTMYNTHTSKGNVDLHRYKYIADMYMYSIHVLVLYIM